jgi:hypothetical protein
MKLYNMCINKVKGILARMTKFTVFKQERKVDGPIKYYTAKRAIGIYAF